MWTYDDRLIAEEAWAEYEATLTDEQKEAIYAPKPELTGDEWMAALAALRAGDDLDPATFNQAETEMERDATRNLWHKPEAA